MASVEFVQAKWLKHHFIHIAQHVVQAQRVGFEQARQLQLAVGRLGTFKPLIGIDTFGHRVTHIVVLGLLHLQAATGGELPLDLGGQTQKTHGAIFLGQLGRRVLAQPLVVAVGRLHGLQPADVADGYAQTRCGLGACCLRQRLVLQLRHLVLGQQVVARLFLAFGEAAGNVRRVRMLDIAVFGAVLTYPYRVVIQRTLHRHKNLAKNHKAFTGHGQQHIVFQRHGVIELCVPR